MLYFVFQKILFKKRLRQKFKKISYQNERVRKRLHFVLCTFSKYAFIIIASSSLYTLHTYMLHILKLLKYVLTFLYIFISDSTLFHIKSFQTLMRQMQQKMRQQHHKTVMEIHVGISFKIFKLKFSIFLFYTHSSHNHCSLLKNSIQYLHFYSCN